MFSHLHIHLLGLASSYTVTHMHAAHAQALTLARNFNFQCAQCHGGWQEISSGAQRSPWAWRHHNVSTVQSRTRQEAHISVWWMAFYYYYYELKHHDSSARLPGVPLGRASKHRFWCTVYGLLWKRNDFQSLHDMLLLKSSKSKKIVAWWLFFKNVNIAHEQEIADVCLVLPLAELLGEVPRDVWSREDK